MKRGCLIAPAAGTVVVDSGFWVVVEEEAVVGIELAVPGIERPELEPELVAELELEPGLAASAAGLGVSAASVDAPELGPGLLVAVAEPGLAAVAAAVVVSVAVLLLRVASFVVPIPFASSGVQFFLAAAAVLFVVS